MRRLALLALLACLAACTPSLSPGAYVTQVATAERPVILNAYLGVRAPEGAGILELRDEGRRTTAWFTISSALQALEPHFEFEMLRLGWQRVRYDPPQSARWEAAFTRAGERVTLRLIQEDWSGRYRFEVR